MEDTIKKISLLLRSRTPIIYVVSSEETRVLKALNELCVKQKRILKEWTITDGFTVDGKPEMRKVSGPMPPGAMDAGPIVDPVAALDDIVASVRKEISEGEIEGKVVYVLKDFHPFLQDNIAVIRRMRDFMNQAARVLRNIIILSPVLTLPAEIEQDICIVDFPLPDQPELRAIYDKYENLVSKKEGIENNLTEDDKRVLIKAVQGLTNTQAENVFSKFVTKDKKLDKANISLIFDEKVQSIRKTGILEYLITDCRFENIGGLENLKEWFLQRKNAFINPEKAQEYKLPNSKGVLLLGVPGCGKSLIAKALGNLWELPVLRLDVGKIFQGIVGASENNVRQAIKLAEAISPSILFIDEIEKGFSGTSSSNYSDAGTASRVFSTFLNWLQEKKKPVFVVATANDIGQLQHHHPEFFRHGRWDAKFFVDLPNDEERKQIWAIHIKLKGRDPANYDLDKLTKLTRDYTGAEIEQAVSDAMFKAFAKDRDFEQGDLEETVGEIQPMAETAENIMNIRAQGRAVAVSASRESAEQEKYKPLNFKGGRLVFGKIQLGRPEDN